MGGVFDPGYGVGGMVDSLRVDEVGGGGCEVEVCWGCWDLGMELSFGDLFVP